MGIFRDLKNYLLQLNNQQKIHQVSKDMVDGFARTQAESETERTAPLTDMIDYHKNNPSSRYKLNEETIKIIERSTGLTYEQMQTMDDDEITAYIEKKTGKKMTFSKHGPYSSGDDSVTLSRGRYRTMEDVDRKIDAILGIDDNRRSTISKKEIKKFRKQAKVNEPDASKKVCPDITIEEIIKLGLESNSTHKLTSEETKDL